MRKGARCFKPFWPILFLLFLTLGLTGCVSPATSIKVGDPQTGYRKVYLVQGEEDPRAVVPRIASRLRQTGFDVTVVSPKGPSIDLQGSGFVVSPEGYVLTCAHVVTGATNATIWVEGVRYPCRVVNSNTNLDLALLKVEGDHPPFRPLRLESDKDYSLGENVFTMGFPLADVLGTSPRLNSGLISAKVGMNDDTNFVQISVPVQPGNSGGPLLNANGQVIGVVSSTLNPLGVLLRTGDALPQNVNFAIKLLTVRQYLASSQIILSTNVAGGNFDEAEKSIALVRPGNVSDDDLHERALVCVCTYQTEFDYYWHFHLIAVVFVDAKTSHMVLTVVQEWGTYSEEEQLNYLFSKICTKFFPDRPNPFKGK